VFLTYDLVVRKSRANERTEFIFDAKVGICHPRLVTFAELPHRPFAEIKAHFNGSLNTPLRNLIDRRVTGH
jgi:hypothetical protein